MPATLTIHEVYPSGSTPPRPSRTARTSSATLGDLWETIRRRRWFAGIILCGLMLLCTIYCLTAPKQYEARARIELRTAPASSLTLDGVETQTSPSVLTAPIALETLANVLRSDRLAWRVIVGLRLYQVPGFADDFNQRYAGFDASKPTPEAQAWLLDQFAKCLHVQSLARTLLVEIRFRSHDAVLSAAAANALIHAYQEDENESQIQATAQASDWLDGQLADLKAHVDSDQQRLSEFEIEHGIVSAPEPMANGETGESEHNAVLLQIDELSRQLVAATSDRILAEAEFRAASHGDPEAVAASNPRQQSENANFATSLLQQIHGRRSELEQEKAQLSAEHGPNFPRVVEIGRQLQDLDQQTRAEDAKLVERFRSNWQTAVDREQMIRKSLAQVTSEGMKLNQAATEYAVMRQEANASHELYLRVQEKTEEAGMAAGVRSSKISVVDFARQPVKPISPNLPLDLAITFFAGIWIAIGAALVRDLFSLSPGPMIVTALALLVFGVLLKAQPPLPSTSGLPTGVVNTPLTQETRSQPNARAAPAIWDNAGGTELPGSATATTASVPVSMPGKIAAGDFLDIGESHTPEFHSMVRVSPTGRVTLPMIGEIAIAGMDEPTAAHAIESALVARGMLLHPLVSVLVTASAGQDVSVLGEVARPGVYPYTVHHRLLDLISAAAGLSPNAGRLVNIIHQEDQKTPHSVALDPEGTDTTADHNPELSPGDTVQVSRAGLVFVVGDVIRPGGFPVDPVQGLTVVQALSLAWGPTQNAAVSKAVLIRQQKGGRTMISLNIRRMLRGQDPDQRVQDRDILYLPDSVAKNLVNRTLESAIQSTVGITIYSALVYSQRY